MGWDKWTTDTVYEIERIASAVRLPGGWRFMVKWKGYPDPTPEPLWKLLRDTNNPEILEQIEKCKEDYLSNHPAERTMVEPNPEPEAERPTRTQPSRTRAQTERFTFMVYGVNDPLTSANRFLWVCAHSERSQSVDAARCTNSCRISQRFVSLPLKSSTEE